MTTYPLSSVCRWAGENSLHTSCQIHHNDCNQLKGVIPNNLDVSLHTIQLAIPEVAKNPSRYIRPLIPSRFHANDK